VISNALLVFTSQKRGKAHSPNSTAPARYTGRRPTRSESADQPGRKKIWAKLEIRTAASMMFWDIPRFLVP
jgi:hypothetical protein